MNDNKQPALVDDWDSHWASYDESASMNPAQRYRHRLVLRALRAHPPRRLLDIGSGQGDLLALIARAMPQVQLFGVELSQTGVDRTLLKVDRADARCMDLLDDETRVRIADIKADCAVCCEVLEHLDDPVTFLRTATAALTPGATLIVTVPGGPRSDFDRLIGHRRHYTRGTLRHVLSSAGFIVTRVDRAGFPFFNLYRMVVIGRGKRLATDVADGSTSRLARYAMRAFDLLFRLNLGKSRWGWQNIAIARLPIDKTSSSA